MVPCSCAQVLKGPAWSNLVLYGTWKIGEGDIEGRQGKRKEKDARKLQSVGCLKLLKNICTV